MLTGSFLFGTAGEQFGREEPDIGKCTGPKEQSGGTVERNPQQQGLNPHMTSVFFIPILIKIIFYPTLPVHVIRSVDQIRMISLEDHTVQIAAELDLKEMKLDLVKLC